MKRIKLKLVVLAIFMPCASFSSTMGADGIYYTAINLKATCHTHFPQHKEKTDSGYNKWFNENHEKIKAIKASPNFNKYLNVNNLLIQSAIKNKEVTMRQLEYKCTNIYKNLTE